MNADCVSALAPLGRCGDGVERWWIACSWTKKMPLATARVNRANVRSCEGFQTLAVTNVSTGTAASVWKPPRDETAGRGTYWAVPHAHYGDLAVGGPH